MKKLSKAQSALIERLKNTDTSETIKEAWTQHGRGKNIKELGGVLLSAQYEGSAIKKTIEVLERLGLLDVKRVEVKYDYVNPNTGAIQTFSEMHKSGEDFRKAETVNHRVVEISSDSNYWNGYYLLTLKNNEV